MSAHLLHNPSAPRRVRKAVRRVLSSLRADGHRVTVLAQPTPELTSATLAKAIARDEVEQLIIAGGDGLVHLAIQHIATSSIPVTLCPIGSGNDFARAIHEDAETTPGTGVSADLIQITTPDGPRRWAASVAIAGFPAEINGRANAMSRHWGPSVYSVAAGLQLPYFQRRTITLSIDDTIVTTDTAMLAIGNTKYFGGGMLPCPDARPDDHLLHLTSIEGVGRLGLLPHLRARQGGTADRSEVRREQGRIFEIESPGESFWADGEPLGSSPLVFEIVPDALKVERVTTDPS